MNDVIDWINTINSMIRGLINYYQNTTFVSVELSKYSWSMQKTAYNKLKRIKEFKTMLIRANNLSNLRAVHMRYKTKVVAIEHEDVYIGITSLGFCKWKRTNCKRQNETPFSADGRQLYTLRTHKKPLLDREDEIFKSGISELKSKEQRNPINNFEYYMNRGYVFNRDKGKCKICSEYVSKENIQIHRMDSTLAIYEVNKVKNLATLCNVCYNLVNSEIDLNTIKDKKKSQKIKRYRLKGKIQIENI